MFSESEEFYNQALTRQQILTTAGDCPIDSLEIRRVDRPTTTSMVNEMFANITGHSNSYPDFKGLHSLVLSGFVDLKDLFDEKILAQIAAMATNLKVLEVSEMNDLPEAGRVQLVEFATKVIENNESDMTTINIEKMAS